MRLPRLLMIGGLLTTHCAWAYGVQGRVVGTSDGDTITVLDSTKNQHKIRLAGIDAPESKQAFGQASKKHMSALVFNRDVTLDCDKTDKYGREVCIVLVDGQDANLAQVRAGMAWWYRERAISGATVVLRGRRGCGEGWARGAMEGY
jgi:endonuclease YncB( thermonuclease family)